MTDRAVRARHDAIRTEYLDEKVNRLVRKGSPKAAGTLQPATEERACSVP